jgi:site-specific DNA recombinase
MRVTEPAPKQLRAVDLIRVSDVNGRDKTEKFVSPDDQRLSIARIHKQHNLRSVAEFKELNKSGYSRTLKRRPGLLPAIEMIERGEADVICVAYFDRLFRKTEVKIEAFKRMLAAGGDFITGDLGTLETKTAAQRLNLAFMIAVAEFQAEQTADKTAGPKARAVEMGIPPFPHIPAGYRKDPETRRLVKHEAEAEVIRAAYRLRAAGSSLKDIRDFVRANGINLGWRGVQEMLKNRIYLGELHFKALVNLHSHAPIIEPNLFRTIQKMRVHRGKKPVSTSLFARQGLVRCTNCGGRMVVGQQTRRDRTGERVVYRDYRCSPIGDCTRRQSIGAQLLEDYVIAQVRNAQAAGRWSPNNQVAEAEAKLAAIDAQLNSFAATFDGLGDLAGVQAKIRELKEAREAAAERVETLRSGNRAARVSTLAAMWDRLSLDEQRTVLRLMIDAVEVSPGKGTDRIFVRFFES